MQDLKEIKSAIKHKIKTLQKLLKGIDKEIKELQKNKKKAF